MRTPLWIVCAGLTLLAGLATRRRATAFQGDLRYPIVVRDTRSVMPECVESEPLRIQSSGEPPVSVRGGSQGPSKTEVPSTFQVSVTVLPAQDAEPVTVAVFGPGGKAERVLSICNQGVIEGLTTGRKLIVLKPGPLYVATSREIDLRSDSAIVFELRVGQRIQGFLTNRDGFPLRNCEVRGKGRNEPIYPTIPTGVFRRLLQEVSADELLTRRVRTDDRGYFELLGMPDRDVELEVSSFQSSKSVSACGGQFLSIVMEEE